MSKQSSPTLCIVRRFEAPRERVFDAWLAPEVNSQWLFASGGERVANEMDTRPGGSWLMTSRENGKDYTACGEYQEIARPQRLAFTFAMPQFSSNRDLITIEFKADGDGCVQTFTQAGPDIAAELRQTREGEAGDSEQGWGKMFDKLEVVLS